MEVVASLSQGRTAAAQCGLFTHKSVSVIFELPCLFRYGLSPRTSDTLFYAYKSAARATVRSLSQNRTLI